MLSRVTLSVSRVQVIVGDGADKVLIQTDKPSAMPSLTSAKVALEYNAAKGEALNHIFTNFDDVHEVEVLDMNSKPPLRIVTRGDHILTPRRCASRGR